MERRVVRNAMERFSKGDVRDTVGEERIWSIWRVNAVE